MNAPRPPRSDALGFFALLAMMTALYVLVLVVYSPLPKLVSAP